MGCFSWKCNRCNLPVNIDERAVRIDVGVYDGYGRVVDGDGRDTPAGFFHEKCFKETFKTEILLKIPECDPEQGFGPADPRFMA